MRDSTINRRDFLGISICGMALPSIVLQSGTSESAVGTTVFVGSNDNYLYAVDAQTGNQQWTFEAGDVIDSSPTVVDGSLYVGSWDGYLYAVEAQTGDQQWTFETDGEVRSSPTVVDGTVYVGSWGGDFYAVDAQTGDQQWKFTNPATGSSPTLVDGTIYIGSWDGYLYAVDAQTGDQKWRLETDDEIHSSPTVVDGVVYVGSWDEYLYAVDAQTGNQQWTFKSGGDIWTSPTVVDGIVYFGSADECLYAMNSQTGDHQWTFEADDGIYSSPTVVDGTVYVGSADECLYAVDAQTGDHQWTFEADDEIHSSPTVVDGTVYVGSMDECLYAVDAQTGDQKWHLKTDDEIFFSSPTVVENPIGGDSIDSRVHLGTLGHHHAWTGDKWDVQAEAAFTVSPVEPKVGEPAIFDASESIGNIETYEWEFNGDKVIDEREKITSHSFDEGTHTVTLTVSTKARYADKSTETITVQSGTTLTPEFTITPVSPEPGEEVVLDASNSTVEGNSIDSYEWDLTDDGSFDSEGQVVTTEATNNTQIIKLRVTTHDGQSAEQERIIRPSRVEAQYDYHPTDPIAGEPITFDATGSTADNANINSYLWEFDDGTEKSGQRTVHSFNQEGSYIVTLTIVADNETGTKDTQTKVIQVSRPLSVNVTDTQSTVPVGDSTSVNISIVSHIAEKPMTVQLILHRPRGVHVTRVSGADEGSGQVTAVTELQPGREKNITIGFEPTEPQENLEIKGELIYTYRDGTTAQKEIETIKLEAIMSDSKTPVKGVEQEEKELRADQQDDNNIEQSETTSTTDRTNNDSRNDSGGSSAWADRRGPGFDGISGLTGLASVSYLLKRRLDSERNDN